MTTKAAKVICGNIKGMFAERGVKLKPAPKSSDIKASKLIRTAVFDMRRAMYRFPCSSQRIIATTIGVSQTTIFRLLHHKIKGNDALDLLRRICVSDRRYKVVVPIIEKAQQAMDGGE
ncbi:MAG: hypothetical protein V3V61_01120 [Gammaproteobacteria bacterium]